jgi:hypothetical protein
MRARGQTPVGIEWLMMYAQVARELARHEIPEAWDPEGSPDATLKFAVLGALSLRAVDPCAATGRARPAVKGNR